MTTKHEKIPSCTMYKSAFLMAAISGFSDVFGFVGLDHLFTAHITGNIVIIISFILENSPGIVSKIIAIPVFIIFAFIISSVIETQGMTRRSLLFWLSLEIILFITLLICGLYFIPMLSISSKYFIIISMLPVCAMAIHNTLLRTYMSTFPPCTVMTGNLTQFVVDVTAFLLSILRIPIVTENQQVVQKLKRFGNVLSGFILGGLMAAFGYIYFHFWCALIIIGLLVILLCLTFFHKST